MTHPAAIFVANAQRRLAVPPWLGQEGPVRCGDGADVAGIVGLAAETIFNRPLANFVEMRRASFHYSVIDGTAKIPAAPELAAAPGLASHHLLHGEVSTSNLCGHTAGEDVRAADDGCLDPNRTGDDFEPVEERRVQMGAVSLKECGSQSRLRTPE